MSRFGEEERMERLVKEYKLTKEERDAVHRHLGKSYQLEKTQMSYEELKAAASEVVSRIR